MVCGFSALKLQPLVPFDCDADININHAKLSKTGVRVKLLLYCLKAPPELLREFQAHQQAVQHRAATEKQFWQEKQNLVIH